MRIDYDAHTWRFVARIMDENSERLSRTRAGVSDTSTSSDKPKLLAEGDVLARHSASNEEQLQRWLHETRHSPRPKNGIEVLDLLGRIADLVNAGLTEQPRCYRTWPSDPKPPAPASLCRRCAEELPSAMMAFAERIGERWDELKGDPVPLAAWAEWELNGGSLHPYADGCGRISRGVGAMLLIRGSSLLPLYEDREQYFARGHIGDFADYVRERIAVCAAWLAQGEASV